MAITVLIETSIGELVDKITILELKAKYLKNENQLRNVEKELTILSSRLTELKLLSDELVAAKLELGAVNESLWHIEDQIRVKEKSKAFDDEFIQLARSVYIQNDKRAKIKRTINDLTGSNLTEEKSYADYGAH